MKAFILAAGRGERMRPLTDTCPKPLLKVKDRSLIEWQLLKLKAAGIAEVVINTAYLGHMIEEALGDGQSLGLKIYYSQEPQALETGGAILHAQSLLDDAPFLLINSDIWLDLDYAKLITRFEALPEKEQALGYLVLVTNPAHNLQGDFTLDKQGRIQRGDKAAMPHFTFSGVSILDPRLVLEFPEKRRVFPLREAFVWAISKQVLFGEVYTGEWLDVGTPERLAELAARLTV